MGTNFSNFEKKVLHKFSVMGFVPPKTRKITYFTFLGHQVDCQTPYDVIFHRKLKSLKNQLEWYQKD